MEECLLILSCELFERIQCCLILRHCSNIAFHDRDKEDQLAVIRNLRHLNVKQEL
jgi:hypothetical protein